jgi:hypothetical protein
MKKIVTFMLALTLMIGVANGQTPVFFDGDSADPGADTSSNGDSSQALWDALGGGWDHINGSDQWDGTGPGAGKPGGVGAYMDGPTDFIRIQDTGNPGQDPGNRKVYLAHQIDFGLDGAHLDFRVRLSTAATGPLDDYWGGGPWATNGDGYDNSHDAGKGNICIREQAVDRIISFVLNEGPTDDNTDDVLFVGDNTNVFAVGDFTIFHDFDVDIADSGGGVYAVSVSMDAGLPTVFNVTAQGGNDYDLNYIAMGMGSTGNIGAMDVDYFGAVPEPMTLTLLGLGGLGLIRRRRR